MSELTNSTLITGAQFREFYLNNWPKGWYHEDAGFEFEDEEANFILPDDKLVKLGDCGYMVREAHEKHDGPDTVAFIEFYREYAQAQTVDLLVVKVPKERRDEILALLEKEGCIVEAGTDTRNPDVVAAMAPR